MDIIELIPSADVTTYIKETGWAFSEWDKASILFNVLCDGLTLAEKAARLRKLGAQTQDQVLAEQIRQRIALEAETQDIFFRSAPGMFYMAAACDDETPLGYYATAEDAVRRGKREGSAFEVCKYRLIGTPGLPPVWSREHRNPYLLKSEQLQEEPGLPDDDQDDGQVGCASFNEHGELCSVFSREALSAVSEAELVELSFSPRRFENRYVELPNPFQCGDIVRVTDGTGNGRRGVVETSQEWWAHFQGRIRDGLYVDFSDACITVEFPTKNGFSHDHVSPLYLERCQSDEDDPDHDILEAGSLMLRRKCSLEYFTYTCQKYREKELSQCTAPTSYS